MATRLAVLGQPIAHSLSPQLHNAAYATMGLDWEYTAIEVAEAELEMFLAGEGSTLRGCSATMPLKQELLRLAAHADETAVLTDAANTVIGMDTGQLRVFNTDPEGIVNAAHAVGLESVRHAILLGGGATASSSLAALAQLGTVSVEVRMRDARKAGALWTLAEALGLELMIDRLDPYREDARVGDADLLISTLPARVADSLSAHYAEAAAVLLDVAYEPWPSQLAQAASNSGARVISGLEMLYEQAVIQIRIFLGGDPEVPLPDEARVRDAMRRAIPALCQD